MGVGANTRLRESLAGISADAAPPEAGLLPDSMKDSDSQPATGLLEELREQLSELPHLVEIISRAIVAEPPLALKEGGLIRDGFDSGLDELRSLMSGGKDGSLNCNRTKSREQAFSLSKSGSIPYSVTTSK
jgi:DNA mismatch repair ATPase MutS